MVLILIGMTAEVAVSMHHYTGQGFRRRDRQGKEGNLSAKSIRNAFGARRTNGRRKMTAPPMIVMPTGCSRCRTTRDLYEFQNIEKNLRHRLAILLFFFLIPQGRTSFGRENTPFPRGKRKRQRLIRPSKIISKRNSKLTTKQQTP